MVVLKKTISVAKLELQAALLGAWIAQTLGEELSLTIRRRRRWTDSSCARNWLRTTASYYKPFVSYRFGEVQTLKQASEWWFVPGKQNPADWATRSTLTSEPIITRDWIEGPEFLKLREEKWPTDIPWIQEKAEIRTATDGRITLHTQAEEERTWKKVEFYVDPSYTALKGPLLDMIRRCQAEEFPEELNALAA